MRKSSEILQGYLTQENLSYFIAVAGPIVGALSRDAHLFTAGLASSAVAFGNLNRLSNQPISQGEAIISHDDVSISPEILADINYQAFQKMFKAGAFREYPAGTYVVFSEGKLVAEGMDLDETLEAATETAGDKAFFFDQVNIAKPIYRMPNHKFKQVTRQK